MAVEVVRLLEPVTVFNLQVCPTLSQICQVNWVWGTWERARSRYIGQEGLVLTVQNPEPEPPPAAAWDQL